MSAAVLVVLLHGAAASVATGALAGLAGPMASAVTPDDALAEATRDFDALRLEAAAVTLEALIADPGAPPSTRARALLLLGLTRAGLVDERGAVDAFARALTIDPALTVPPDTSPKVRALFDQTRASLPPPPPPSSTSPPPTASTTAAATPSSSTMTTAPAPATPGAAPSSDGVLWTAGAGAALLATAGAAAIGVAVADHAIGTPVAGRTRAEHDQLQALGLASLAGSVVLGVAGVSGLVAAAVWSMDDAGVAP